MKTNIKTSQILLNAHQDIARHERKELRGVRPNATKIAKDSLPCPFCGCQPELTTFDDGSQLIGCVNWRCGAYLHRMPPHYWEKRETQLEGGWISKELFEQVCEERDKLVELTDDLYRVLSGLLSDITEYQDINNLGGENNHWQIKAREILNKLRNES